jgi:hypothetical protein
MVASRYPAEAARNNSAIIFLADEMLFRGMPKKREMERETSRYE